ncbi:DUF6277 family protein (plasmid) [Pantoea dispersa]|uniref:DUF6277 family protein n=1 Tax=Pantoea dispersa TaxID=59814 RepID=UPI001CA6FA1C|nr:DUF6277 family protein [Pantoea dispersa]QZY92917.1 DUF6277 family protein [Pantoea dispersa]
MIKANIIMDAVKSGIAISQNVQNSFSEQFAQATQTQSLPGGETASTVAEGSGAACSTMTDRMNSTLAALKSELAAHQRMQQQAMPEDYAVGKHDLRDMPARGFPGEEPFKADKGR